MHRITMWLLATGGGLVLLFSYRSSTMGASPPGSRGPAAPPGIVSGPPASAAPAPSGSSPGTRTDLVVNGTVAQTRWGPVQVRVRISGGRIVEVTTIQVPDGNRQDEEINAYAVPQLKQETLDAQSANVDTVSGATVTSDGYRESLQAALDAAHFTG